jgi:hypothetical protein
VLDSIDGFVARTGLSGVVDIGSRSVTCRATGATLTIEASDSASAFGTRPWLVLVDEVAMWPDTANHDRLWGAIVSALGKVPGSRLLVMSSAGSPSHPAFKRWNVAQTSPHWRTSITPGPSPWWSPADVAAAAEQLTPTEFRRFLLCEWAEANDSLATADDVAACVGAYRVLEPQRGIRYTMALDVGTRRDSTVLAIGHLEPSSAGRKVVIDRVLRWTGSRSDPVSLGEVETALLACWRSYGRPRLCYDFHQAAQLTERLKGAGVTCEEFTFSTAGVNRLARVLFAALRDRAISLPDDEALIAELGSVRLVETGPGLVRLDHRSGEHDDQAVTIAMVAASLLERPTGVVRILIPQGRLPTPTRDRHASQTSESGPTTVQDGEQRPASRGPVRLGAHFARTIRGTPGYTPPGGRC